MEADLDRYKGKYEELLEEKKDRMDSNIDEISRYQTELTKMINITESLHNCFEEEKEKMKITIEEKDQLLAKLEQEKQEDRTRV